MEKFPNPIDNKIKFNKSELEPHSLPPSKEQKVEGYSSYHFIIRNLAFGSTQARNEERFKAIVTCLGSKTLRKIGDGKGVPKHTDNWLHIPIEDESASIIEYFDQVINFIDQNISNGEVLVHCYAGESRSVAFCAAYLISKGRTLGEALDIIRSMHPKAKPHPELIKQLRIWASKHRPLK